MADPKERLRIIDSMESPDLWAEAVRRGKDPASEPQSTRQGKWRRPVTILVALAVFAGAATFVWSAFSPPGGDNTPTPGPAPTERFDVAGVPEGWTRMPFAPQEVPSAAATAWTGEELLVWGGFIHGNDTTATSEGFRFDFATGVTSAMSPSPLSDRGQAGSAWTGDELLIWGGWRNPAYRGEDAGALGDGAAYDPATDTWRMLPPAPISPRAPLSVWTGSELIVWGTSVRIGSPRPVDGAAYDPSTDTWREIAPGPIELTDADAVWTGGEMIVFGAALHSGNIPETPTAIGAAYFAAADTWRELPPSDMSPNANAAVWTGEELVVWDYGNASQVFDLSSWSWRLLPDVPIDSCEGVPFGVGAGGSLFGQFCAEQVVLDDGVWHNVTRLEFSYFAQDAFFVGGAVVTYGQSRADFGADAPILAYAYRPPASFACGGFGPIEGEALAEAIAWRLALLRSDRPEGPVVLELQQLLSLRAFGSYGQTIGRPLVGKYYPGSADIESQVDDTYSVILRMNLLSGSEGTFAERLLIRPGKNLGGESCSLVVDEIEPI